MNLEDARELLALVRALDRRTVDLVVIQLWRDILDPFTLAECLWALKEFARVETREYLRPAHLVEIIRRKRYEFAASNPGRGITRPDQWLEVEAKLAQAVALNRGRTRGQLYAVEAMDGYDLGGGS